MSLYFASFTAFLTVKQVFYFQLTITIETPYYYYIHKLFFFVLFSSFVLVSFMIKVYIRASQTFSLATPFNLLKFSATLHL